MFAPPSPPLPRDGGGLLVLDPYLTLLLFLRSRGAGHRIAHAHHLPTNHIINSTEASASHMDISEFSSIFLETSNNLYFLSAMTQTQVIIHSQVTATAVVNLTTGECGAGRALRASVTA